MTYDERKKWLCEQCIQKSDCAYLDRDLRDKCPFLGGIMCGWQLGYEDAIDKACEFMLSCEEYVVSDEKSIYDNFIKFIDYDQ